MNNQRILRNIFITIGAVFALPQLLVAATFITFDPPGSTSTSPLAITATGAIIGSYKDAGGVTHGFLRKPNGTVTTIDVPGSAITSPTDINPTGVITGWYCDTAYCLNPGNPKGFVRAADGTLTTFSAPVGDFLLNLGFARSGPAPGINPVGAIVGTYSGPICCHQHGFLRTPDGRFRTIDYPGADYTNVVAINPAGVIVGDFCNDVACGQGFLRTPDGTFTVINANAGFPTAINSVGEITGFAGLGGGVVYAGYFWSRDGTFTTFTVPGLLYPGYTAPWAINCAGAITGYYWDPNTGFHGFVRARDGNITTFDAPGSTVTLAFGINSAGIITGSFYDASFVSHGFVRIP